MSSPNGEAVHPKRWKHQVRAVRQLVRVLGSGIGLRQRQGNPGCGLHLQIGCRERTFRHREYPGSHQHPARIGSGSTGWSPPSSTPRAPRSIPTSSRVSRTAVARSSASSASRLPPGSATCPDQGSPERSARRMSSTSIWSSRGEGRGQPQRARRQAHGAAAGAAARRVRGEAMLA